VLRVALMNATRQIISPDFSDNHAETERCFSLVNHNIRPLNSEEIGPDYAPDDSFRFHFATQAALFAWGCVISNDLLSALDAIQEVYNHAVTCTGDKLGLELRRAVQESLIAWALGNDPLPALLARLESEAGA
jgi:hypothetical protein